LFIYTDNPNLLNCATISDTTTSTGLVYPSSISIKSSPPPPKSSAISKEPTFFLVFFSYKKTTLSFFSNPSLVKVIKDEPFSLVFKLMCNPFRYTKLFKVEIKLSICSGLVA
jgi:hypothetical protein